MLQGTVSIDESCAECAWQGLAVYAPYSGREVERIVPDERGHYAVSLPQGVYVVDVIEPGESRRNVPAEVRIAPGRATRLDVSMGAK